MPKSNSVLGLTAAQKGKTMILQDIPESIKSEFKSACAKRDKSMRSVILDFMQGYATGKVKI